MKEDLVPCRYCKCKAAETYSVDGLWYVRCRGVRKVTKTLRKDGVPYKVTETKKCSAWSPYSFLGLKEQNAIDNWNERNTGNLIKEE